MKKQVNGLKHLQWPRHNESSTGFSLLMTTKKVLHQIALKLLSPFLEEYKQNRTKSS